MQYPHNYRSQSIINPNFHGATPTLITLIKSSFATIQERLVQLASKGGKLISKQPQVATTNIINANTSSITVIYLNLGPPAGNGLQLAPQLYSPHNPSILPQIPLLPFCAHCQHIFFSDTKCWKITSIKSISPSNHWI